MRYITERELRDQFASGVPDRYDVPSGCMLTPAARQYLLDLKLYRHPSPPQRAAAMPAAAGTRKPEHMTNLNARTLVCKTHPRILLRGKLDTLESEILMLQCTCAEEWRAPLKDALSLARSVLAAVTAFWDGQKMAREDIVLALNRLSSYFYVLQLRAARR